MRQYELHPPHLIGVATLPYESQNRKCNITVGYGYYQRKLRQMYYSFFKVYQGHHVPEIYLYDLLYSKACIKQRFMTSTNCENAWSKLVLTLTRTSSMLAWPSEIMCTCWWWTLWTHAMTWVFIYMVHQHILWNCQCNWMHVTTIL